MAEHTLYYINSSHKGVSTAAQPACIEMHIAAATEADALKRFEKTFPEYKGETHISALDRYGMKLWKYDGFICIS